MNCSGQSVMKECYDAFIEFKDEVEHKNRFIIQNSKFLSLLLEMISFCTFEIVPDTKFYRARIFDGDKVYKTSFTKKEMEAPPAEKATAGRVNPNGIAYLYLASDIKTAISEVRPWKSVNVNISCFKVVKSINVFFPIKYLLENKDNVNCNKYIKCLGFLLNDVFSTPINPYKENEYLISQYIAEFVKSKGLDGLYYISSLGRGVNLALFDKSSVEQEDEIEMYKVVDINYETVKEDIEEPELVKILKGVKK